MRRFLSISLLLALVFSLSGCTTLRALFGDVTKPEMTFKRVQFQGFSLDGVTLGLVYEIDNPYEVGINLAEVAYQLEVDGNRVFSGSPNQGLKIPAGGKRDLVFPATIRFADVLPAARTIFTQDKFGYRASGRVGVKTPVGMMRFPISKSGTFDAPELPQIRIADVRAPRVTASGAELQIALDVTNKNGFPLPIEGLQYGLELNGSRVGGGNARGANVAAGGTQRITLPIRLGFLDAGRGLQQLLSGKSTNLGLTGKLDFGNVTGPLDVAKRVTLDR